MFVYYRGCLYEAIDNNDDTEYDQSHLDLTNLGLIFGHPKINGNGVEVEYGGRKIIITPSNIKKAITPLPKRKKDIKYNMLPAYFVTDGKSGRTVLKEQARSFLRDVKKKIDSSHAPMTEGFFKSLATAATDGVLKGMGFGELPGQSSESIPRKKEEDHKNAS